METGGKNMTEEQIKHWIENYVENHPNLADEFKLQRLEHLQVELRYFKRLFDKKGDEGYRNPKIGSNIVDCSNIIKELEQKSPEQVLVEDFVKRYGHKFKDVQESIDSLRNASEEDCYICGVFNGTKYSFIKSKKFFDSIVRDSKKHNMASDNKQYNEIYKKGLANRAQYIKIGADLKQKELLELEEELHELEDIGQTGAVEIQEMIDRERSYAKDDLKDLAQMSVEEAFNQMGAQLNPKQSEEIDRIIELHDPVVVERVVQKLTENPTENMVKLAEYMTATPEGNGKKVLKGVLEGTAIGLGAALVILGFVSIAEGNYNPWIGSIGSIGLGIGIASWLKHSKKNKNGAGNLKDKLVSGCIEDLLNEVVLEEIGKVKEAEDESK